MSADSSCDVVIAGGGPVGAALALALAGCELRTELLDARTQGEPVSADRSIALSHGARLILSRLGLWDRLAARPGAVTPIAAVDVSQRNGFGSVRLDAAEHGVPALGYVASYRALQSVLDEAVSAAADLTLRFGTRVTRIRSTPGYAVVDACSTAGEGGKGGGRDAEESRVARLAVVADGGAGGALPAIRHRRHDYRHLALVGFVGTATPHAGIAYERFTPDGPVALLPSGEEYALVWTVQPERAQELLACEEATFLRALQAHFGDRRRGFTHVRERRLFPLAMRFATEVVGVRVVAIGNAAQMLHPVAGQGFNLGLRDAFELARSIVDSDRDTLGSRVMLAQYARRRHLDRIAGAGFTHALSSLFGIRSPLVSAPRGLALALLDALPPAKWAFTQAMLHGLR